MNDVEVGHQRLIQVFQFLQAFNERRNPAKCQVREQEWVLWLRDLPKYPAIEIAQQSFDEPDELEDEDGDEDDTLLSADGFLIKVQRPSITPAPSPPAELAEWLAEGWDDPDKPANVTTPQEHEDALGQPSTVRFEDDPRRVELLNEWGRPRERWAEQERPTRAAMRVFESLYELHARIERESEQVELILGDGILNWRRTGGGIHHPIILQRMQLEFGPDVPEFILRETDRPPELYSSLFRSTPEVDGKTVSELREELQRGDVHPLGGVRTSDYLRRAVARLASRGEFLGDIEPVGEEDFPRIGRQPVLFLRRRILGFAAAIEAILQDLPNRTEIPSSLLRIVGVETQPEEAAEDEEEGSGEEDERVLLTKPANREQTQIARRLAKHRAVLVQGPPGTGKTHTIANLIGHLLAQGKSVLVTSHTTKALRVLREQVDTELQPLCVSVLDADVQSRDQLESSARGIVERLSRDNAERLGAEARALTNERAGTIAEIRETRSRLVRGREDEYREVVTAAEIMPPAEAARRVNAGRGADDWIPAPVERGWPMPLSTTEVFELYRTNRTVTADDERELARQLPSPDDLVVPEEFRRLVMDASETHRGSPAEAGLWDKGDPRQDPGILQALIERLAEAVEPLSGYEKWRLAAAEAGHANQSKPWESLLSLVEEVAGLAAENQENLLQYHVTLSDSIPVEEQSAVLREIADAVPEEKRVGSFTLLLRPRWRRVLNAVSVNGRRARRGQALKALADLAFLEHQRRVLRDRWERQMAPLEAPALEGVVHPERAASDYVAPIERALRWSVDVLTPLMRQVEAAGFRWSVLAATIVPDAAEEFDILKLREMILHDVQPRFEERIKEIRRERAEDILTALIERLQVGRGSPVADALREAVVNRDLDAYESAYHRLLELGAKTDELQLRRGLLAKLDGAAQGWAGAIRERRPPHDKAEPPADPERAWLWRQLSDELDERNETSLDALQTRLTELKERLEETTVTLVDRLAWKGQLERTSLEQQQALIGFSQLIRRIGRGTGRRAPRLRLEAQRQLGKARTSVPVWIMPLSRVVDSFDLRETRFDVVIIDEASQSDVLALIALYLGKSVVIVGDHQQVTPDAVGVRIDEIEQLIRTYLRGIPNAALYDGQQSIYNLGMASFGGLISLREHFRCAPDIIQFSNGLSYDWQIKPLRDPAGIALQPHLVPIRVEGSKADNNVNEEEAQAVASLLAAAVEQPEYAGKTFGVISLLGDDQARRIDALVRHNLDPTEYERRRIICGNAAHFQGDERDVMFLSLVDSPEDRELRFLDVGPLERSKKRYNVASSRARDQLWLVHSLDPQVDLKPNDLRRRLIEHVRDPGALLRRLEQDETRTESDLERRVLQLLTARGYWVLPQHRVGYKRIDMVLKGHQVAIECDGDRFHPIEKLQEDMERQAVLERLGWSFIRIRGTQFYRDPESTMDWVVERLEEMGVSPSSAEAEPLQPNALGDELIARVVRRAAEIREGWPGAAPAVTPNVVSGDDAYEGVEEGGDEPNEDGATSEDNVSDTVERIEGTAPDAISSEGRTPIERALEIAKRERLTIVDKRLTGGAFWVVAGAEYADELRPLGFAFAASGGRATRHRPAWYLNAR